MSEAEGGGERTEAPTQKKIDQSREQGQIARSRELSVSYTHLTLPTILRV